MSSGFPTDIWIDHNELFSSMATCAGAGDSSFDGLIDFKKGADRVTVSYNYIHDHHKATLNGFTDTDDQVRHITFDHNVFENVGSRTPLQRHGYNHMLNNVFNKVITSGINVRMGGYSLVEANYFETVKNAVPAAAEGPGNRGPARLTEGDLSAEPALVLLIRPAATQKVESKRLQLWTRAA